MAMNTTNANHDFPRFSGQIDAAPEVLAVHNNRRRMGQRIIGGLSRRFFTRLFRSHFAEFGQGSYIDGPSWIRGGESISIGNDVQIWRASRFDVVNAEAGRIVIEIGDGVVLNPSIRISGAKSVRIGPGVGISSNCFITDNDHYSPDPTIGAVANTHVIAAPTSIGAHAWIGEKACVLKGVTIGTHSIIGAGSVVVRDVPPFSIAAGVPARVIKTWCHDTNTWIVSS